MNGMTVKSCFQFVLIQVWLKCYVLFLNYSCVILFLELLYTVHCLLLHVAHMFPVMQSVLILFYRELLRCLYYLLCTSKKKCILFVKHLLLVSKGHDRWMRVLLWNFVAEITLTKCCFFYLSLLHYVLFSLFGPQWKSN